MKTRIFLVAMALVVFASLSFGQGFCRFMYNDSYILTVDCSGGAPLPDGTPVYIHWDNDSNGPDADDPLASACPPPCVVNYDQFTLNGEAMGLGAGLFIGEIDFCSIGCMPAPAIFYLVIHCPTGGGWNWVSAPQTFVSGPGDAQWSQWTCNPCGPPPCTPGPDETINAPIPPNQPYTGPSVCLYLCPNHTTTVTVVPAASLPIDAAHAPMSHWVPGCDQPCSDPTCPPAVGAIVAGPFPNPAAHNWYYTITSPEPGCLCFTFDYWLAVGFNNDFVPTAMDNAVKLTWSSNAETAMLRYDIVRGNDVVGHVDAANAAHNYEFVDGSAVNGTSYTYTLLAVGINNDVTTLATTDAVTPSFSAAVITEYALHQNFPNPFNPSTEIAFDVLNTNPVTLKIYNAAGQEVATLLNGASKEGGKRYVMNFDATNLTSGLYFYTVKIGSEFSATKKMLLVK